MFKKFLSVLVIIGVLFAFAYPEESSAAPPKWWTIVKADALGALDGYLGSGSVGGAIVGGVKGSLEASIAAGTGGGSWDSDATADASVGLHHNLALNYIYQNAGFQGESLTDAERKRVIELLNKYMVNNDLDSDGDGISDEYLSPAEVEKGLGMKLQVAVRSGQISQEFYLALEQAIELLDSDFDDQQAYIDKSTPLLYQGRFTEGDNALAEIFLDVVMYSSAYWEDASKPDDTPSEPIPDKEKVLILTLEQGEAAIDGLPMPLDVPPFIRDGRTLVPFRFIGEQLGASIGWNPTNRAVSYVAGDIEITLFIDSTTALVNGEEITLDTPPILENSRTVVPVRFISEALGFTVDWLPDVRQIVIKGTTGPFNPN